MNSSRRRPDETCCPGMGFFYSVVRSHRSAMTRSEITLAVGTALLSFFGALVGVYVGSKLEQSNWESRFHLEQKRLVLEKRVALVERMTIVLNKIPLMTGLQASLDAEKEFAQLAVYCASKKVKRDVPSCQSQRSADIKHVEEIGREIYALNAEWAASASLSVMYFGQKTREAVQNIKQKGPWSASEEQRQMIIEAMGSELNVFDD